jgi:hypothetical protein
MARARTTKKLAQRIDLDYFKRPTAFKSAKLWLNVLVPLLALGWIGYKGFARDSRVYSRGRMSEAHAVLEKQCAACHVRKAGEFSSRAADSACESCHDGPAHHENAVHAALPECATCHMEHRGRINISAASNESCAKCHQNLKTTSGAAAYASHIESLEDGHPEFRAVRADARDPSTIALNHAIHMKPIRKGPNGPLVQLECGDCHRAAVTTAMWTYGDARYVEASVTYKDADELLPAKDRTLKARGATNPRAYMAPVKFATACAGCHSLSFDKHFDEGAPHDKPEVIHAFLVRKFQQYIAAHPGEVRVVREPMRGLTGETIPPEVRVLTPAQWVTELTAEAEKLLWRKTCKQCHVLEVNDGSSPPRIAEARVTEKWLPHAKFDHDAHRGFSCAGCHAKALTSTERTDVLVPGIANCKTCHAPGSEHSESRCFECHTYHDWAKRKDVKPTFEIPGLVRGGL